MFNMGYSKVQKEFGEIPVRNEGKNEARKKF